MGGVVSLVYFFCYYPYRFGFQRRIQKGVLVRDRDRDRDKGKDRNKVRFRIRICIVCVYDIILLYFGFGFGSVILVSGCLVNSLVLG